MSDILVTIVLPIYNVEKYLERSVNSIVNQSYKNLDIILIDDGSKDNCPSICDEWAKKDHRIRVVHKENAGLSMARNTGIDLAKGKYIFFLDSDDFVEHDLVECSVKTAVETGAQIIVYGYDRFNKDGKPVMSSVPELPKTVMLGEEIREIVVPCVAGPMIKNRKKYHLASSAWAAMYSVDVIRENQFYFVSEREIISEDVYSNLIYYQYIDCIAIIPRVFYHYCENNEQSLSRTYNPERFERNKHFYSNSLKLCGELGYSEQTKKNLSNQMLSNIIVSIKQMVSSTKSWRTRRAIVKQILSDGITKKVLNDYDTDLDDGILRKVFISCMKIESVSALCFFLWLKNLLKK